MQRMPTLESEKYGARLAPSHPHLDVACKIHPAFIGVSYNGSQNEFTMRVQRSDGKAKLEPERTDVEDCYVLVGPFGETTPRFLKSMGLKLFSVKRGLRMGEVFTLLDAFSFITVSSLSPVSTF